LKVCPKCGKKYPEEYGFCLECGSRLEKGTPATIRTKPAVQKKVKSARRLPEAGRRERKKVPMRIPVAPPPSPRRKTHRETLGRGPRVSHRMAWESVYAGAGLAFMIFSFLLAYSLIGKAPASANLAAVAILMAMGAIPTVFWLRGSSDMVRIGGGTAFAAAGLGLLISSFLATYGLLWETLQLANGVWLGVMIAVGVLLTVTGIPMLHELGNTARKVGGSAFATASLGALVLCVLAVHDSMGRALQPSSLVWLGVMIAVGAFAAWEGFPLVLEPKDRIRMVWEGAFMTAGIGTLVSCVVPVLGLRNGTLEPVNAVVWVIMLLVISAFLLAKGIELVRE